MTAQLGKMVQDDVSGEESQKRRVDSSYLYLTGFIEVEFQVGLKVMEQQLHRYAMADDDQLRKRERGTQR